MTFDLCIPAFNESEIIERTLNRVTEVLTDSRLEGWTVVVSDNGSSDSTGERVREYPHPQVTLIQTQVKGKGAAILAAAHNTTSQHFGFIDADLSADPQDILQLLEPILNDEADVVIGSRLLDARMVRRGPLRSASSHIFNGMRRVLLGIKVVDSQCGLKVMNANAREVLGTCEETGWFLDLEFLAKAERAGLRILELPVHWNEEEYSGRSSKLRIIRDGFGAVTAMIRIRKNLKNV